MGRATAKHNIEGYRHIINTGSLAGIKEHSGAIITNTGASSSTQYTLENIATLDTDSFIRRITFRAVNPELFTIITQGANRIIVPSTNQNTTFSTGFLRSVETSSAGVYQVGASVTLESAEANKWSIVAMTGVWATELGNVDSIGEKKLPFFKSGLTTNLTVPSSTVLATAWTDFVLQQPTWGDKKDFTWATPNAVVTANKSGIADIYASISYTIPVNGSGDGAFIRVLVGGAEIGRNNRAENVFMDSQTNLLNILLTNIDIAATNTIKVQLAHLATSGSMTVYTNLNTFLKINYKRG